MGEGVEEKTVAGKGEKWKGSSRCKRMCPCPRSNKTEIIHPGLETHALPIAPHCSIPWIHLGCVYSEWTPWPCREPLLLPAERYQATSRCSPPHQPVPFPQPTARNMQLLSTHEALYPETHTCLPCSWANSKKSFGPTYLSLPHACAEPKMQLCLGKGFLRFVVSYLDRWAWRFLWRVIP